MSELSSNNNTLHTDRTRCELQASSHLMTNNSSEPELASSSTTSDHKHAEILPADSLDQAPHEQYTPEAEGQAVPDNELRWPGASTLDWNTFAEAYPSMGSSINTFPSPDTAVQEGVSTGLADTNGNEVNSNDHAGPAEPTFGYALDAPGDEMGTPYPTGLPEFDFPMVPYSFDVYHDYQSNQLYEADVYPPINHVDLLSTHQSLSLSEHEERSEGSHGASGLMGVERDDHIEDSDADEEEEDDDDDDEDDEDEDDEDEDDEDEDEDEEDDDDADADADEESGVSEQEPSIFDHNSELNSFSYMEDYTLPFTSLQLQSETSENAEARPLSAATESTGGDNLLHDLSVDSELSVVAQGSEYNHQEDLDNAYHDWEALAHAGPYNTFYDGAEPMDTSPDLPNDFPFLSLQHVLVNAQLLTPPPALNSLPPSFQDLFDSVSGHQEIMDLETGLPYAMLDDELDDNTEPEYLVVDQERNFYFSDFCRHIFALHRLHPNNAKYKIGPNALQVPRLKRPSEVTAGDMEKYGGDIQGILWDWLDLDRRRAREVRNMTYTPFMNMSIAGELPRIRKMLPNTRHFFGFRRLDTTLKIRHQHFQLRNLLSATSKNDIFYGSKRKVYRYDPCARTNELVFEVQGDTNAYGGFPRITTMSASHGVIVAGTYDGDYAVKALDAPYSSKHVEGSITDNDNGITNHIHITPARTSHTPLAVFSSNDSAVRVLDCYRNEFVSQRDFDFAINCTATSPDTRLRVVVGDAKEVIVMDADRGDILHELPGHQDYGFACAWSDDGYTIATGNQDLMTRIYDARNFSRAVTSIDSEMACVRALRFSPVGSGPRVLVMSEPADMLHVVDAVSWKSRQHIDMFGEIVGMSFTPDGRELFVANADPHVGGLLQFERRGEGRMSSMTGDVGVIVDDEEPWLGRRRKRQGVNAAYFYS